MISNRVRATYYALTGPIMKANGSLYRSFRAPRSGLVRVQLGSGQKHYLPGWINVDANIISGKLDVWANLRDRLPFRTDTVDALYSHHVIEHIGDMRPHFHEAFRILKPGGVYRVAGPNGDTAMEKFRAGAADWFGDTPDAYDSLGGKLHNFIFCGGDHFALLTESYLRELLERAGFRTITRQLPIRSSTRPDLFEQAMATEYEDDWEHPHTLVLEAVKPGAA